MERKKTFCLGDFQVEPGEKKSGYILIGNGEFELPITVLNGEKSGKTVLITAGIHGAEYVGIQSSIELAEHLKIEKIVGTVVIIKVVNRQAFEMRSGSEGFEFKQSISGERNRKSNGTISLCYRKRTISLCGFLY